jgi:protein-disulfide isomerase
MNNPKNSNINVPLVIISLVLIVAGVGGWFFYNRSKNPPKKNTNNNTSNISKPTTPPPTMPNAPIGAQPPNYLGSPNASVVIEEFADFQCPSCGATHPILKEIQSVYGSRIKFIFRNYPLAIPAHDKAYEAAVAAEAAGIQGKFWDMHNLLYTNQAAWSANPDYHKVWEDYAQKIGLDVEKFKADMMGMIAKPRVEADLARGRALNINSTPTIFINGVSIPYDQMNVASLRQIIDSRLQEAQASQQQNQSSSSVPTTPANSNTVKK